jgi:hypothetical protein
MATPAQAGWPPCPASGGRWAARNVEDPCLGDLDAGTYKSQFIATRLDPGAEWAPEFGAVTYTVPNGWANDDDFPSTFGLQPSGEYARAGSEPTTSIFLFTQPTAESQQTPCSGKPQPGVRRTVADEMRWLRQLPGLATTQPVTITIDGHQGQWIDLRLDPAWTTGCGDDKPFMEYLLSGDASEGIVGLVREERQRLVLLDLGDGDLLGIQVRSSDPARFEAFAAEAMPIIQSFQFE